MSRNLKLFPSPIDYTDRIVKIANPTHGTSVDLSINCSSIKNQGNEGSCTSFATIAAMEYLENKFNTSNTKIFSERFTYYVTRVNILGWNTDDNGAYIRSALQSVVKIGTCLNNTFPYNGDFITPPPALAYEEAKKYEALTYARFDEGTNEIERTELIKMLKANLDAGFPIISGFMCYSNLNDVTSDGKIPLPNNQQIGGHAILVVGYNEDTQCFKIRNSWGDTWGDHGYAYLPYAYYLQGHMYDLWSIYTAEDNYADIGIDITNPILAKQALKNEISDLLANVQENIDIATNTTTQSAYFTSLEQKYNNNPSIARIVRALDVSISAITI
jgi:C1A family cysteine protease